MCRFTLQRATITAKKINTKGKNFGTIQIGTASLFLTSNVCIDFTHDIGKDGSGLYNSIHLGFKDSLLIT